MNDDLKKLMAKVRREEWQRKREDATMRRQLRELMDKAKKGGAK